MGLAKHRETMTIADLVADYPFDIELSTTAETPAKWWHFEVLGIKVYCYNFQWRQQAIAHHDLHHIVTGYPCTLAGEVQVAAWEFAAGRYPNLCANLFCLPLITCGIIAMPKRLWTAFRRGRQSHSLFNAAITPTLLNSKLSDVLVRTRRRVAPSPRRHDIAAFCGLVSLSLLVTVMPVLLLALAARQLISA
ncbi:MAG: hypothetical protein AAF299_17435 [Pseudomonadota bacterium]